MGKKEGMRQENALPKVVRKTTKQLREVRVWGGCGQGVGCDFR